jgi:hypothetical protein
MLYDPALWMSPQTETLPDASRDPLTDIFRPSNASSRTDNKDPNRPPPAKEVVSETTCDPVTDKEFIQEPWRTDKAVNTPIPCTERLPPIRVVEKIERFDPNLEKPAAEKEDPAA